MLPVSGAIWAMALTVVLVEAVPGGVQLPSELTAGVVLAAILLTYQRSFVPATLVKLLQLRTLRRDPLLLGLKLGSPLQAWHKSLW